MMTLILSGLLIALGVGMIVRTVVAGVDGGLGLVIGALFVLLGTLRLYLYRAHG